MFFSQAVRRRPVKSAVCGHARRVIKEFLAHVETNLLDNSLTSAQTYSIISEAESGHEPKTRTGRYYQSRHVPLIRYFPDGEKRDWDRRALSVDPVQEALALGRGMQFDVLKYNIRAQKLYEALGFSVCEDSNLYRQMRWSAGEKNTVVSTL